MNLNLLPNFKTDPNYQKICFLKKSWIQAKINELDILAKKIMAILFGKNLPGFVPEKKEENVPLKI